MKIWDITQHIARNYMSNCQHFRICYCERKSNFSNKYLDFWITLYLLPKSEAIWKIFSAKIGKDLKDTFFQNWRKFERYFLPKSEKTVSKFSKAGGRYPSPPLVAPPLLGCSVKHFFLFYSSFVLHVWFSTIWEYIMIKISVLFYSKSFINK